MTPVLKNCLSVFRRYRLAVVLNILGLSVAFAAFMIIMIQLNYDFSFDKFHKNYDKIFRLEFASNTSMQAVMNRPLAEQFIESSPQILAGALTSFRVQTTRFHVDEDSGARNFYE